MLFHFYKAQMLYTELTLAKGQDQYIWMMCHVLDMRQHYCSVATLDHVAVVTMKMLVSDVCLYPVSNN